MTRRSLPGFWLVLSSGLRSSNAAEPAGGRIGALLLNFKDGDARAAASSAVGSQRVSEPRRRLAPGSQAHRRGLTIRTPILRPPNVAEAEATKPRALRPAPVKAIWAKRTPA